MKLYSSYTEAKESAKKAGFKTAREYNAGYKQHDPRLPCDPRCKYAKEWKGWYDFLGQTPPEEHYTSFSKARSVARNNLFLSADDYFKRYKEVDPKLPSHPDVVYQDQWQGWRDFLSSRKIYETFEEAKTAARLIQFRGTTHYKKQCKKFDKKLPIKPENSYRNEWTNWRDFLGTPQKEFYSTY